VPAEDVLHARGGVDAPDEFSYPYGAGASFAEQGGQAHLERGARFMGGW
jgi:hypothetical protein